MRREGHTRKRETPLPMYVGLSVHAKTHSRDLVEKLHNFGLCISYDRVLSISTNLRNVVCDHYHQANVVCPLNLRMSLFTTAAVDDIDHNPTSTFHGTGISMFQHPPTEHPGVVRERIVNLSEESTTKSVAALPEAYTDVRPVYFPKKILQYRYLTPKKQCKETEKLSG